MASTPRPDVRDLLRAAADVRPVETDPVAAVLRRDAGTPRSLLGSRRRTVVVASAGLVAVAAGTALVLATVGALTSPGPTSSTPAVVPDDPPIFNEGFACTQVGVQEGVSVDLTAVLPLEGGDYYATVSVPSLGASRTVGFAGNDEYGLGGGTGADLTSAPVEVDVRVVTEWGDVAYERSTVVDPQLDQPNGAACDGEVYTARLQARPSGDLVQIDNDVPWEQARDERGRASLPVHTACGLLTVTDDSGADFVRIGGVLDDGAGGPPPGWNAPYQRGWVSVDGDVLTFEDERGHVERFQRTPWAEVPRRQCG